MRRNLPRVLKQKMSELKKLFARDPRVLGVWLLGSQADGTATPRSDIDFAVLAGNLLYERDYARVSDFVERILIEYPDYAQFLERFNADFLAGVRQNYGRFRYSKNHRAQKGHRKQPAQLEAKRGKSFEESAQDTDGKDAVKYRLQTAVQAVIDISSHICARLGFKVAGDSGECVRALEKAGLLSTERATMYVKMIRFRNVLAHLYGEVDDRRVHEILEGELDNWIVSVCS